jgi:predicted outer membrane repeat protein
MKGNILNKTLSIFLVGLFLAIALNPATNLTIADARQNSSGLEIPQAFTTGSILYVTQDALISGACSSWTEPCALQAALLDAASGDEIWVAAGTYYPDETVDRSASFQLKDGVLLYGGFAGTESTLGERDWEANRSILSGDLDRNGVLDVGNAYNVVTGVGLSSSTVLDGFTITAGNADDDFGGTGGGMYIVDSSPHLTNLTFLENFAIYNGGGMGNVSSSPTLTNVTFYNNESEYGGGLYNNLSNPSLMEVTFSSNFATARGGGMYNDDSDPTLRNVIFSNNTVRDYYGGGMYNDTSDPTLINVIFFNNTALLWHGGGMYNVNSNPTLTNVTFSSNLANTTGGGIYNKSSHPVVTNVIVWGNTPTDDQITNVDGSLPVVTYSDIQGGFTGTGNINQDPLFVDAGTANLRLQLTSSAIDAGNNTAISGTTTDLDGSVRLVDIPTVMDTGSGQPPIVDIGAYEAQVGGDIIYVDQDAPGPLHDGTSWNTAFLGLQTGLAAASAGDQIWVAEGTYTPGVTGNRMATFQLKDGVELYGGFAGTEAALGERDWVANPTLLSGDLDRNGVLDDGNAYHVVFGKDITNTAVMDGFIITGGNADGELSDGSGGGMFNDNSNPTLTNLTFSTNSATYGAGMVNDSSAPTLTNVNFFSNSAITTVGGMYNYGSNPTLTQVIFSTNTAGDHSGGMYNTGSSPTLQNVVFLPIQQATNVAGCTIIGKATPR